MADIDVNPDGGLETLVDLRRPQMLGDSGLTGVPSIILDPNEFRLERMLKREHLLYGIPTPFVGRRDALEKAYNAVRDAVNTARVHALGVVGGSGVGKTRLLAEMFAIIDPLKRGIEVQSACGSESEPPDGLGVIAQLIRRRFKIAARDTAEAARDKIVDAVEPLVDARHLGMAARQLAYLAGLRGQAASTEPTPKDILKFQRHAVSTFTNLFRYYATEAPQIVVVHRAQYLTPRAITILEGLMAALHGTAATFVFVGDAPTPPVLVAAAQVHVDIPVKPLPPRDMDRLVRAILRNVEDLPDGLVADILGRSAGNPRLAEDNIRLLIQRGAIEPDEGRWTFHPDRLGAKIDLASTSEAASSARVAALAPDVRHVLEMASVFGPAFWRSGLLAMLRVRPPAERRASVPWFKDEPASWLERVLDTALREDLVVAHEQSALPGQREMSIAHRHDRQTLENELDPAERALYHRLVAQWLGGLPLQDPGPWHEIVAEHFEAGDRPERAAARFLQAADAARDAYAVNRAKALYRRALAKVDLDAIDILVPVLRGFGDAHFQTGDFAQARRIFSALLEASLIQGDRETGAGAWLMLGRTHRRMGENRSARLAYENAQKMYRDLEDTAGLASVHHEEGTLTWLEGKEGAYDEALRLFGRSLELRRKEGDRSAVAESLVAIANVHLQRRRFGDAEEGFTEARALRHAEGDRAGEAYTLVGLGAVRHAVGNHRGALDAWRAGLDLAERLGDREQIAIFLNNLGEVYVETGDLPAATESLHRALEIAQETGDTRAMADIYRNLGSLHIARGEWDRALENVEASIGICRQVGLRPALGVALRTKGEILSTQLYGDDTGRDVTGAEAVRCFDDAIALFEEVGDALELQRTLTAYARHTAERGHPKRAQELLARARALNA